VGGLSLIEARSTEDEKLAKTFSEDHYRKYLDFQTTVKKLKHVNFKVHEMQESQRLSPYKKEDPFLMRIVAQRL
jgi:tellurite methyltransferase